VRPPRRFSPCDWKTKDDALGCRAYSKASLAKERPVHGARRNQVEAGVILKRYKETAMGCDIREAMVCLVLAEKGKLT
jgi:hypothetical protein